MKFEHTENCEYNGRMKGNSIREGDRKREED